ncbi:MAG: ArsR/SmtB family transcription factor [Pseudothermotoga sp.]|nr:metalloregulator ArsR/SmtB family transcription factor [Pseudothermotoga sp.]
MNRYLCSTDKVHQDRVKKVIEELEGMEAIDDVSTLFSTFCDLTRLKILLALEKAELCGCDLCAITGATKSAISHQMRILKMTKLVKSRRQGKQIFYSLADQHVVKLLRAALEHVKEESR